MREIYDWSTIEKPGVLLDVGGYRVHYLEQGTGPVVLLLHGFGGHTFQFRHLAPRLAVSHRVVMVDLKGFGYSERHPTTGLSHTDQVEMLRVLLDKKGLDQVIVLGHSMGGLIAQRLAATHPERVRALILAASATGRGGPPRIAGFLLRPVLPLLAGAAAARLLALSYHDRSMLTEEVREAYMKPTRIRGSLRGLSRMLQASASDQPIDLESITAPALLLLGRYDRVIRPGAAARLQAALPRAEVTTIDGAGHMLLEEKPAECARAIFSFLGRPDGPS